MRAQAILHRTRSSLIRKSLVDHPSYPSLTRPSPSRFNGLRQTTLDSATSRLYSTPTGPLSPAAPESEEGNDSPEFLVISNSINASDLHPPEGEPETETEKPKRTRTRISTKEVDPPSLPSDLNILWSFNPDSKSDNPRLIPQEIFDDALTNLHSTLYGPTQHRSVYPQDSRSAVEPTLGLYCPIEGGDYLIDHTVSELARATGADVVVIDAVELAAGEWGHFGQAAGVIQFSPNPLHFSSNSVQPGIQEREDEDDRPPSMTVHVMSDSPKRPSISSRDTSFARTKAFFDAIVNLPVLDERTEASTRFKPRLIYVKDVQTISPLSASWYPHLLAAVRQRRQGPISRPTSQILNPMTIVLGISSSITGPTSVSTGSSGSQAPRIANFPPNVMSLLAERSGPTPFATVPPRLGRTPWSESTQGDRAREQRLRKRLRTWEHGGRSALQTEMPPLVTTKSNSSSNGRDVPGFVLIQSSSLPEHIMGRMSSASHNQTSSNGSASPYYKLSVIIPAERQHQTERSTRMGRRRRINELMLRMAIGSFGGDLSELAPVQRSDQGAPSPQANTDNFPKQESTDSVESPADAEAKKARSLPECQSSQEHENLRNLWDIFAHNVLAWSFAQALADRVISRTLTARDGRTMIEDGTSLTWASVADAYYAQRQYFAFRKSWIRSTLPLEREDRDSASVEGQKEKVERIKRDPDLDSYEQRLLGCIVDASLMPTSFNEVHLPPHTIDSVRTMVSLPLLHPSVFQQGILKTHAMNGCLLFGPPGTGKTLLVKALAKEAGCQMLSVAPSDVMDMYVGEGEKLVRSVFSLARRLAPCVVFLDEIDSLFGARASAREGLGGMAHRGILTEFMQEMDGLKSSKEDNVIVIGATNRPFDLDDAVLRRLPRRLLVDIPGITEREAILRILLRDEVLGDDVNFASLAQQTEAFSGSDLKHLCVSAALDAVKEHVSVPWAVPSTLVEVKVQQSSPPDSSTTEPSPSAPSSSADEGTASPIVEEQKSEAAIHEQPTSVAEESSASMETSSVEEVDLNDNDIPRRVLRARNFAKALREITPSSSEALGTLTALRRWNDEFGEGGREKRRKQVWGRDRFGFVQSMPSSLPGVGGASNEDATLV